MAKGDFNKILHFKTRFIQILRYLGSPNAQLAASEIEKLPDLASDGFHDAYLTSKLLSIALTYMTKKEFKLVENDSIKSILLATLFGRSEIEKQVDESIGNVFAYCNENPEESLEESLEKFIQKPEPFKWFSNELQELKSSCDLFITFYEINKAEIEKSLANFKNTFIIKNSHKGPQEDEDEDAVFLSDPLDKSFIEDNGTLIINRLRPCLGLLVLAEDDRNTTACLAHHHMPAYSKEKILFSQIHELINEMKSKGYVNQLRIVITGGNLMTFSLVLKLMMTYWEEKEANLFANININLLPSPEGCMSYCIVKLIDSQCVIMVGAQLYKDDLSLCEERDLDFVYEDSDSDLDSESSEEESLSSDDFESSEEEKSVSTKKRDRFFYHSEKNYSSDEDEPEFKKNRLNG